MKKKEFIEQIAMDNEMSVAQVHRLVDSTFSNIIKCLVEGGEFSLSGFGRFYTAERKGYLARNPMTGEKVLCPSTRIPRFKPGLTFKNRVSGKTFFDIDNEKMSFEELIYLYCERFKDTFPTFNFGNDPEECSKRIIKCLKENKPYKVSEEEKDVIF